MRHLHTIAGLTLLLICGACANGTGAGRDTSTRSPDTATSSPEPHVPTGASGGTAGSGTSGPHEGSRASTPPGTSRDDQPPAGGAIVDPTGAATKTPPPPGMR